MAKGKGTALAKSDFIKKLFTPSIGAPPNLTSLMSTLYGQKAPTKGNGIGGGLAGLLTPALSNSGSSNRVGMGLSDFGLQPSQTPAAPNVVGQSKHGTNALQQAAIAALTSQFDPVLGQINNAMGTLRGQAAADRTSTTNRGNRAEGDLATLYGRLRQYAGNTQRVQDQDYRAGVRQTRKSFNALGGQIKQDLSSSGGGVASELKRMGIDPSIALASAAQDAAFSRSMVREDRANQVSNTRASRREYDAGMGRMKNDIIATGNAAIGGARAQTNAGIQDINRQLSTNILQLQMQRAQTLGQRAAALSQYKLSQLQAKAAGKDPMAHLNLLLKQTQLAKALKDLNNPAGFTAADKGPGKGIGAALNYLQQTYPTTNAGWSTQKRTQLSSMLEDLVAQGSRTKSGIVNQHGNPAGGTGAYWDPKQEGDLLQALYGQMAGIKGPKGNPMYGNVDRNAMQQALLIALGIM
jgi:hypothetical protein